MVQLVFVHGVATRTTAPGYAQSVANRDMLFREVLFNGSSVDIHSPAWGDVVPKIPDGVYATAVGVGAFGLAPEAAAPGLGIGAAPAAERPGLSLSAIARVRPDVALDAVFAELLDHHERDGTALTAAEVSAFAKASDAISADIDAARTQDPTVSGAASLIGAAANDEELAFLLQSHGILPASYGIGGTLLKVVTAITDRVRNAASTIGFDLVRGQVSPAVGFFLGDVFAYLHASTVRASIQQTMRGALIAAHTQARESNEKLVLIGHSLGGVILVDLLCSPQTNGLPDDLRVDALLTVGSQPGLFQALRLLVAEPAGGKVDKPHGIASWYNVFDPIDPLAFRADASFNGVEDLQFDSLTGLASAHTTYFKRPQFYARCRKRFHAIGVV